MSDWRPSFEGRGNYRATCRLCGLELDVRGNRPQKHLEEKHPGPGRDGSQAGPITPPPDVRLLPPAPAPAAAPPPPLVAPKAPPADAAPVGGSREELLLGMWSDSRNKSLTATERARARELIAKVEGYAEEKEADTEELRLRHLDRVKKAMDAQGGVEAETLRILTDPVNGRASREWLRDLLARAEGVQA